MDFFLNRQFSLHFKELKALIYLIHLTKTGNLKIFNVQLKKSVETQKYFTPVTCIISSYYSIQ